MGVCDFGWICNIREFSMGLIILLPHGEKFHPTTKDRHTCGLSNSDGLNTSVRVYDRSTLYDLMVHQTTIRDLRTVTPRNAYIPSSLIMGTSNRSRLSHMMLSKRLGGAYLDRMTHIITLQSRC